jgi:hypothetical protein
MGDAVNVFELLDGYPGIDLGGFEAGMALHLLKVEDIVPLIVPNNSSAYMPLELERLCVA